MSAIKPCTLGKRHKWAFVKNVVTQYQQGSTVRISQRGKYQCECGARKLGEPAHPFQYQQQEQGQSAPSAGGHA